MACQQARGTVCASIPQAFQIDSRHLQVLLFVFFCLVLDRKFAPRRHVYLCLLLRLPVEDWGIPMC